MKAIGIFMLLSFYLNIVSAQTNRYYQQTQGSYVPQYTPQTIDHSVVLRAAQIRQQKYDNNEEYLRKLTSWILELKDETDDKVFNNRMDDYLVELDIILDGDLSLYSKELSDIQRGVNREIEKYNSRMSDPNTFWDLASEAMTNEDYTSALENLNKALELNSRCTECYLFKGYALANLGEYAEADENYSTYISLEPDEPTGYEYRGYLKYAIEEYTSAIADFSELIKLKPTADAYLIRGNLKLQMEDFFGALDDYKETLKIDPRYSMAHNNIAHIQRLQKKYPNALNSVNQALDLDEKNYTAYFTKAEILFDLKKYDETLENCSSALELFPEFAEALFYQGRAYYRNGKHEDACVSWSKAGQHGHDKAHEFIRTYCKL